MLFAFLLLIGIFCDAVTAYMARNNISKPDVPTTAAEERAYSVFLYRAGVMSAIFCTGILIGLHLQ